MEYEKRALTTELRAVGDGDAAPTISGYAALFNVWSVDLGGFQEQIQPGAFTDAIKTDDVRALYNHDPSAILGRTSAGTLTLREDNTGLWFDLIPPDTQVGRDLVTSIRRGDVREMSFQFAVPDGGDNWAFVGDVVRRTLSRVSLRDVSPVTFPAYPQTSVSARSQAALYTAALKARRGGGSALARDRMHFMLELSKRAI